MQKIKKLSNKFITICFTNFSLLIIILNTILILISDPTDDNNIGNSYQPYDRNTSSKRRQNADLRFEPGQLMDICVSCLCSIF